MIRERELFLVTLLSTLAACVPGTGGDDAPSERAEPPAPAPTNRIDIPASVRSNLGVTFAKVEVRRVAQTLRVPGAFELQPRARREYRMALPGRVQLLVDQYQPVEVGTPLFRYQSPAWPELLHEIIQGEQAIETAHAEIAVARARLQEARRRLELARERIEVLARADFKRVDLEVEAAGLEAGLPLLEAEVTLAETSLANARRTREHALHRAAAASDLPEAELEAEVAAPGGGDERVPRYLTIDWIEVRAHGPGVVETLAVTDGAFVEPPASVVSTVDPQLVRFRAQALQADLPALTGAREAHIAPPPSAGIPIDAGVAARLQIGLEAHPEQRTIPLIATPEAQAEWIRPGVAAFLEVVVEGSDGPALAVPRAAVVQDGLTQVFFRRDPADPDVVIRVEADTGASDGQWVVLESGVMRGDEVVLSGAYELKLALQQRAPGGLPPGAHVHADGSVHGDH